MTVSRAAGGPRNGSPAPPFVPAVRLVDGPPGGTLSDPDDEPGSWHGKDIAELRGMIDDLDQQLIGIWRARAQISARIGQLRAARGGTRLVLAREQQVIARFRQALGRSGVDLALLLLKAGRGELLPRRSSDDW
ncbi:chorismate mutase [Micromonospora haikouensis]|uniref:chorismate mutase n=1 Tax=Micromonospora haikouensis TaxID=686309 RepID=UPI003D7244DE